MSIIVLYFTLKIAHKYSCTHTHTTTFLLQSILSVLLICTILVSTCQLLLISYRQCTHILLKPPITLLEMMVLFVSLQI